MAKKNMSAHLLVAPEKLARKGVGVDEIQITSSPNRSRSPRPDRKCTKETRLMPQELVTLKSHKEQQVRLQLPRRQYLGSGCVWKADTSRLFFRDSDDDSIVTGFAVCRLGLHTLECETTWEFFIHSSTTVRSVVLCNLSVMFWFSFLGRG